MVKYPQKSLIGKVRQEIAKNNLISSGDTIILAVSGGPDSVCLLDVLNKLKTNLNIQLMACHYNHRLRGEESRGDQEFVRELCSKYGIKCYFGEEPKVPKNHSEEWAREVRYSFFKKILLRNRGGKIALAHNANDVAETVLFRLIRGTGLRGLKSIPSQRENFIRPLLSTTRDEIEKYLNLERLSFRIDRTNTDVRFTRNYLRQIVLPELKKINPKIIETLANTANTVEIDYDLISSVALRAYKSVVIKEGDTRIIMDRARWLTFHPSLQRSMLRQAISNLSSLVDITNIQLSDVVEMITKGSGKKVRPLPHSLRAELRGGRIIIEKVDQT